MKNRCPFYYNQECKHDGLCICMDDNEWKDLAIINKIVKRLTPKKKKKK